MRSTTSGTENWLSRVTCRYTFQDSKVCSVRNHTSQEKGSEENEKRAKDAQDSFILFSLAAN
jgi:hypothetical protein